MEHEPRIVATHIKEVEGHQQKYDSQRITELYILENYPT